MARGEIAEGDVFALRRLLAIKMLRFMCSYKRSNSFIDFSGSEI